MSKFKYLSQRYKNIRVRTAIMEEGSLYVLGRYNSDGVFRYELAGGKIDRHDKSPMAAAYRETREEWGRKPIIYGPIVNIKSKHLGIETIVHLATWANTKDKIDIQREEGFIRYQQVNSSNYQRFRYNHSTLQSILFLLKNGDMK